MEQEELNMLKEYDGSKVNQCEALWNIARELSRKNDLLEIEMLCKTAEALRNAAKGSLGDLHVDGYIWAEELACMAHKKICAITKTPEGLAED